MTLEQPELEERHHDLVASIATNQKHLLNIEDQILRLLNDASSGVDVLDDEVRGSSGYCMIETPDAMWYATLYVCALSLHRLGQNFSPY